MLTAHLQITGKCLLITAQKQTKHKVRDTLRCRSRSDCLNSHPMHGTSALLRYLYALHGNAHAYSQMKALLLRYYIFRARLFLRRF